MRRTVQCFLAANMVLALTAFLPFDMERTGMAAQRYSGPAAAHSRPAAGPPQLPTLQLGDKGALIHEVQVRLDRLGFSPGPLGSEYGPGLRAAVWAFQKANGLPPVDQVDPATWRALDHPDRVRPLVRSGEPDRVEIDLRRQLLTAWQDGKPAIVSHISTGTGKHYCKNGHCGIAVTPVGDFRAWWRTAGWTKGPLGEQFYTVYFNGGIGFHGSEVVPRHPASHGCIRVPLHNARPLFEMVQTGEPVYVR
ncbi:L,D-transpeptidase family protein [Streptosporangium sp. NBC_01756]|uniref:L,D-transpeptidase family protein n=1 Tax=Streptosporangium sp. NBC_01756 TaxID=2975950 RepID=UPI002DDB9A23|nr:L,D-transpeptidase family protein [Streptosporangium sp. NBC_01756]WSC89687.1 L,D-transpeptidase family protein [Streptosporangium sp. NBC_01756]